VRAKWRRSTLEVELDTATIGWLVRAGLADARVTSHRRLLGGKSNTNIAVDLADAPKRVVLRLYQRDPAQARKEAALCKLLAERKAPIARMLYFADDGEIVGNPYALMEWIGAERLEVVAQDIGPAGFVELAPGIGKALAAIHAITFPRTGFFADDLRIPEPVDMGRDGLLAYLRRCLLDGVGGARLGEKLTTEVIAFVEREGNRLDAWLKKPCLTHADFNASNILVKKNAAGRWTVAAVLDWEFAFSGSAAFDFGNLLRPPMGDSKGFVDGLTTAYKKAGGTLPDDWRRIARIADLYSWADFLARPDPGHAVIKDARRMVEATIAAG
jgi:aminoglycoside phosphotransferase (APT) family kinase protein